jgi:hypothetical protein
MAITNNQSIHTRINATAPNSGHARRHFSERTANPTRPTTVTSGTIIHAVMTKAKALLQVSSMMTKGMNAATVAAVATPDHLVNLTQYSCCSFVSELMTSEDDGSVMFLVCRTHQLVTMRNCPEF